MNRDDLITAYVHLTRAVLPARAGQEQWVVRADHCFQRIILDNVVGDMWRTILIQKRPAYRQLSDDQLRQAVELAQQIDREGNGLLSQLNHNSLRWRGKLN